MDYDDVISGVIAGRSDGPVDIDGNILLIDTTINDGGYLCIYGGCTANNTVINSAGCLLIESGGTANSTTVNSGGYLSVSDAAITCTTVNSGGSAYFYRETTATGITVNSGGHIGIHGTATSAAVNFGGTMGVYGMLSSADIAGGSQCVSSGSAIDVSVHSGGRQEIEDGYARRTVVYDGGRQVVCSDGLSEDVTVRDSGLLVVDDYGKARGVTVSSGGRAYVLTLSEAEDLDIRSGGMLYVGMGGCAENLTIQGSVHAATGGEVKNAVVEWNGKLYLYGGAILDGVINVSGTVILDDVTHNQGTLNFLVGGASSDQAMLNDYGLLIGRDMSVTVDTSEADRGSYMLAGGAAGFSENMTIYNSLGEELCTLSSGTSQQVGNYRYSLSEQDGNLMFSYQDTAVIMITDGDLNGDGRADVIMTITEEGHGAEGATGAWLIQENQTAAWGDLSTRNPGWEIFGTGWTSSVKATADVYVRSSDNVIGAWTTDDTGKVTGWETIGEFDADTQIVGLGDFNGNGQTDLLLRNTNGAVGCFFTSGEKTGWNYFQSLGDEWKLSAIGDLNGDGRDDVVLKHDAGFAGSWLTQADGTMVWADLDTLPDGFEIVGAGDFNGDDTDDVLLKNGNYYGAWLVNNGNAAGWMGLGDLGDVTVEQIADFNGDGKDDLRIRTAAGDLGTQLVMGEDDLSWNYYGSVGSEWSTSLAALS